MKPRLICPSFGILDSSRHRVLMFRFTKILEGERHHLPTRFFFIVRGWGCTLMQFAESRTSLFPDFGGGEYFVPQLNPLAAFGLFSRFRLLPFAIPFSLRGVEL